MKQSAVIFSARKPTPLIVLSVIFLATLSLLFFSSQKFATSSSQKASAQATQNTVGILNMQFMPAQLTIPAGTTVVWMNQESSTPHTVTSDSGLWDSGTLQPGQTFSHTFMTPGTYMYHCNIHPFMHGSIVVTGATSPAPQVTQLPIQTYPAPTMMVQPTTPSYSAPQQQPSTSMPYGTVTSSMMLMMPISPAMQSQSSSVTQSSIQGNSATTQCSNIQTNTSGSTSNNCNININQQSQTQSQSNPLSSY